MAPLKRYRFGNTGSSNRSFHDWKVMAPLKLLCWTKNRCYRNSFHDWKVMAPLKRQWKDTQRNHSVLFPWLKSHGSIEAFVSISHFVSQSYSFHDWKVMAPLKPNCAGEVPRSLISVSMTEKSWLHWSHLWLHWEESRWVCIQRQLQSILFVIF